MRPSRPTPASSAFLLVVALAAAFAAPAAAQPALEAILTCSPEPTDVIVTSGAVVSCAVETVGDKDTFRFSGLAGEKWRVQAVRRSGGSTFYGVYGPDGVQLSGGGLLPAEFTLAKPGSHSILVEEFQNDATVEYTLALVRVAPPSASGTAIGFGETVPGQIDAIGDLDLFSFDGTAGTTVSVGAARQSGGDSFFTLFAPNGAKLSGGGLLPASFSLTQTGAHSILVEEFQDDATLSYAVSLQCVSGACVPAGAACSPGWTTLCIDSAAGNRRFKVQVAYSTVQGGGSSGPGKAIPLAPVGITSGGAFWFFSEDNPEMLVKVLNGCGVNNRFWFFASAGTNVGLTVTATDTATGASKTYTNPDTVPAAPIQDVEAFATCP